MEPLLGSMETSMKDNLRRITSKVMADIFGSMEESMRVSGKTTKCTERVLSSGPMVENMKENT